MLRRTFLKVPLATGLGAYSSLALGRQWIPSPKAPPHLVVLLELNGGNDGLNTVVPFADDRYHRARPALSFKPNTVHQIDDALGYAPALSGFAKLHKEGELTTLLNVGMPHPDRSHFSSLERWYTADQSKGRRVGWLGRALESKEVSTSGAIPGLILGERTVPLLFSGTQAPVIATRELKDLAPSPLAHAWLNDERLRQLDSLCGNARDRARADASRNLLAELQGIMKSLDSKSELPDNSLGRQLAGVLAMLQSSLRVPVVFVRTGGFDTHARQDRSHADLLRGVDQALSAFWRAVITKKLQRRVSVIVYSEFGRRVAENASRGTDHGAAGPVFMLGEGLPKGFIGSPPDLANLIEGDLRPQMDFRRVLATALQRMGVTKPQELVGELGVPLQA